MPQAGATTSTPERSVTPVIVRTFSGVASSRAKVETLPMSTLPGRRSRIARTEIVASKLKASQSIRATSSSTRSSLPQMCTMVAGAPMPAMTSFR